MMETANAELVDWSIADGIARVRLQRPKQANAVSLAAAKALAQAIDAALEAKPRVLMLTAEGRIFCAGGDIRELIEKESALPQLVDDILTALLPSFHRLTAASIPIISVVNGPIGGAGVGLALCADFVLAAQSMKLRTGYAEIGMSPDLGVSHFLARRVGVVRARQWLMLSEAIDAEECLRHGAVDAVHPDDELPAAAEALAKKLASGASGSYAVIKQLCDRFPVTQTDLEAHLALEKRLLIAQSGSADAKEGIRSFVEKRAPRFGG